MTQALTPLPGPPRHCAGPACFELLPPDAHPLRLYCSQYCQHAACYQRFKASRPKSPEHGRPIPTRHLTARALAELQPSTEEIWQVAYGSVAHQLERMKQMALQIVDYADRGLRRLDRQDAGVQAESEFLP